MMRRRSQYAAALGLVALLAIDVVLVVSALRFSSRSTVSEPVMVDTSAPGPLSTEVTAPSPPNPVTTTSSSPSGSTEPSTTATQSVPLSVLLSAVDGSIAWRAKTGRCGAGGSAVALTTDGGATWRARTTPFPVLSRLQPTDASRAFAVGAGATCDLGLRTTSDGGATWPGTGALTDTLARDPKDPTTVRAPGGRTVTPCDSGPVVDLARSSGSAAQALCADGSIRGTSDDGVTWSKVADQPGAVALDSRVVGGATISYVAVIKPGCQGVTVSSVSGATATDVACIAMDAPAAGTVAISVPKPDSGWLLVGDATWRSSGGLKGWTRTAG